MGDVVQAVAGQCQQLSQLVLPLRERFITQAFAAEPQEIEDIHLRRLSSDLPCDLGRLAQVEARLQVLEAWTALGFGSDDLSVQDELTPASTSE